MMSCNLSYDRLSPGNGTLNTVSNSSDEESLTSISTEPSKSVLKRGKYTSGFYKTYSDIGGVGGARSHFTQHSKHNEQSQSILYKALPSQNSLLKKASLSLAGGYLNPYGTSDDDCTDTSEHIDENDSHTKTSLFKSSAKLTFPTRGYGQSGHILSRTSPSSLFLRRWKESCWLHVYPSSLLLFRSRDDMSTWKILHSDRSHSSIFTGSYDWKSDRLIKWAVNFDTMGVIQRKIEKADKKQKEKYGVELRPRKIGCSVGTIHEKSIHALGDVHSKFYQRNSPLMHAFKLEKWADSGRTTSAAFGSSDANEVKQLRKVIKFCLEITSKKGRNKSRGKKQKKTRQSALSVGSNVSIISSETNYDDFSVTSDASSITYRQVNLSSDKKNRNIAKPRLKRGGRLV